jgi:hypothetical protein
MLATMREFFRVVCDGPDATAREMAGRGEHWKAIDPFHESPLALAWRDLADEDNPWKSRQVQSVDWEKVIGVKGVQFDAIKVGRRLLLRFRGADGRCNQELLAGVSVEPVVDSVDRSGNAIDGRSFDGFPSLPGSSLDAVNVPRRED